MPHGGLKRPMRREDGVGGNRTMKGGDRPARGSVVICDEVGARAR
jgi:hypothetical protein